MKPALPAPLLLTAREAAAMLAISERHLWSLTAAGELPFIRVGTRGVRFLPDDLTAWIESRRKGGTVDCHSVK